MWTCVFVLVIIRVVKPLLYLDRIIHVIVKELLG